MHIVLADDHKLVAEALQEYLKKLQPEIEVSQTGNFDDALARVTEARSVDLVILDMHMPGMNGLEGLKVMRSRFPDLPVVMMSGVAEYEQIREAFDQGAAGFIPKDLSGKAMLKALEMVLSGEVYVPSKLLHEPPAEKPGAGDGEFAPGNPLSSLTPRESQVLSLLIQGNSNKEIARQLKVKEITAAFHLKGVFRKLEVSNRTEAVIAAVRNGWSLGR